MTPRFEYVGRSWFRLDDTGRSFVTGRGDISRDTRGIHGNDPGSEYDADCPCCYLGFAHSIDLHVADLRKWGENHGTR